jgi:hypothetical protein
MMAATTPIQYNDSTHYTIYGAIAATAINMMLHALDLLGLYVLID